MKEKGLALFFYLSGQYDVVLGKSVACQDKKCMTFIQLHFFQVRVIWSSNSWQIPKLYIWIFWVIIGFGLCGAFFDNNQGSAIIIVIKP